MLYGEVIVKKGEKIIRRREGFREVFSVGIISRGGEVRVEMRVVWWSNCVLFIKGRKFEDRRLNKEIIIV
ncbi:hypothetical protein [Nitrobacter winogradskyi]|uniref:Uncharacterized protein n=1 Tax=Nitrobacter winogradskyi TaxID=913 RepID=A0ACC6AQ84_NITWI|nr:hypothetical protein [Nitrobacter winogradskyi]MCP2001090.1 hypothetical protein [Nitrobacter winogradskyi]